MIVTANGLAAGRRAQRSAREAAHSGARGDRGGGTTTGRAQGHGRRFLKVAAF
jgi:hypothetical protein